MSKTKKNLVYSAIVATILLLAFIAVSVMSVPEEIQTLTETGNVQNVLATSEITTDDEMYSKLDVTSSVLKPGEIDNDDFITNNVVSGASPVTDASSLDSALKGNGKHYLTGDISYTASTGNTSAATNGTFGGVLYGNGHTITINVPASAKRRRNVRFSGKVSYRYDKRRQRSDQRCERRLIVRIQYRQCGKIQSA